ncbi:hypothetical protein [Oceanivirga salmonicida]|uniref:hypothetical protein n=1 Tax=Oceanivirga salmonicida TaxID=1769291 RepID=UPI00082EC819|nr:hypothetical protein [Oceanivirga salmonicida]
MRNKLNLKVKAFETSIIWVLLASLISGLLLLGKLLTMRNNYISFKMHVFNFEDLVNEMSKYMNTLKDLEVLLQIYRISILILCIVIAFFIIYRIATKEIFKLTKFSFIISFITLMFSCYLVYITKDIFYALKTLNNRLYDTDFSKIAYLASKFQKIKNIRYIAITIFFLVLALTIIALIINIYEATKKSDIVLFPTVNSAILSISVITFLILIFVTYRINAGSNIIRPFDYIMIEYDTDDNENIIPYAKIDIKKIEKKYVDPYIKDFLKTGLIYEIKSNRKYNNKSFLDIKVAYDIEKAEDLKLSLRETEKKILLKEKVSIAKNNDEIDKEKLLKKIDKKDTRYISNADSELTFNKLFYSKDKNGNLEVYFIQKISVDILSNTELNEIEKSGINKLDGLIYRMVYLGNVYINEKKDILSYNGINKKDLIKHIKQESEFNEYLREMNIKEF